MFYQLFPLDSELKLISVPDFPGRRGKARKSNAIFAWWCNFQVWFVCGRWGLPLCSCELQDFLLGRGVRRGWGDVMIRQNIVSSGGRGFGSTIRWSCCSRISRYLRRPTGLDRPFDLPGIVFAKIFEEISLNRLSEIITFLGVYRHLTFFGCSVDANWMGSVVVGKWAYWRTDLSLEDFMNSLEEFILVFHFSYVVGVLKFMVSDWMVRVFFSL